MNSIGTVSQLDQEFFDRDPRRVARGLLGKLLIRKTKHGLLAGRVVETEAYLGEGDFAAHAVAGRTARNFVLFGPPGFAYVYFIYGNHFCLNVSCLPDGVPGCVLFRALEPVAGIEEMARARGVELRSGPTDGNAQPGIATLRKLSSGPGRLCAALGVTRERDNGKNLAAADTDLHLADDGYRVKNVETTPRIGIKKSQEALLRYSVAGNPFVSKRQ
jgi:DNA-3-methyladenine glycosylase